MTTPVRMMIHASPGFDLQVTSGLINGLPAFKICNATNFANPYEGRGTFAERTALYRDMLNDPESRRGRWVRENLHRLVGHNLACTCPPRVPCHGDVLLELVTEHLNTQGARAS